MGANLILAFILIAVTIALVIVYNRYKNGLSGKKPVAVLRIASAVIAALMALTPVVMISGEYSRAAYGIKKAVYFADYPSFSGSGFPGRIPKGCTYYRFITGISLHGPGGGNGAYLLIRTDEKGVSELEEFCLSHYYYEADAEKEKEMYFGDQCIKVNGNIPKHILDRMYDEFPEVVRNSANVKVYKDRKYTCVIDHSSGTVVFAF